MGKICVRQDGKLTLIIIPWFLCFMCEGLEKNLLAIQSGIDGVVADELGDNFFHLANRCHVVVLAADGDEVVDVAADFLEVVLADGGDADLLVERGLGVLLSGEHLLIELLARTQTGVLDLNILRTAEEDHALGEVGNLHGFAHVEDENLTTVAHGASLEDGLAGFGNEHEVTDDFRIGDGDGTALFDLTFEERNNRAVGTEDIAKASGDELAGRPLRGGFKCSRAAFKRFNGSRAAVQTFNVLRTFKGFRDLRLMF